MKLGLTLFSLAVGAGLVGACTVHPESVEGTEAAFGERRAETSIDVPDDLAIEPRACSLTLRWEGGGSDVKLAGDFTSWADNAIAFRKVGGVHEVTLEPSASLQPGRLYPYKIVVDGQWKLDPNGRYRRIVGGQMNSALMLPACADGPALRASEVRASRDGAMKVEVALQAAVPASRGDAAVRVTSVKASLDRQTIPAGSWRFDVKSGAIDFAFADLAKGKHTLSLRAFDARGRESSTIELPFWIEDEAFDYRDGLLYMMVLDRFANGNRANDRAVGAPVHYDADWHGGDLEGALEVLKSGYFEKLGVRTIWLSPLNTQTDNWHVGDGNQLFSAYHGYWPTKAREVEPRFGGDAMLHAFVEEAHKRGLRVLLDLINNQVHDDHEYVSQHPEWFRRACKCGDDAIGCGWSVRPFDCMFQPYLPDIDWTSAGAEKQFVADAVNWISAFDLDGFRVDAVKHVESNSVYNLRAALADRFEQGGARIFMVGETAVGEFDSGNFFGEQFNSGFEWIDAYTGATALDGQFDFPTRHNMADGLVNGDKPYNEVEGELRKAETRYRAGSHHVRFLNGHDNPRIASIAAKDPKLGCAWSSGCRDEQLPPLAYGDPAVYEKLKRALTVLYTMPGVPYLYAGDEVAFGGGGDPDMRRNMLFGEGLQGLEMTKPGTPPLSLTAQQADLRSWARRLGSVRQGSRAIRRGERRTLLGTDANVWVYAYSSGDDVAIVALNRGEAVSRVVGAAGLPAAAWKSALGTGSLAQHGNELTVALGRGEAAIFVPTR